MDKFRFYKGHRTSLDDLNELQDFFEGSDHARTRDWLGTGVAFGMELTPSIGTLMASVSPGSAYNEFGQRIVLSSGTLIDVSTDYQGNPTGVTEIFETWEVLTKGTRKVGLITTKETVPIRTTRPIYFN